MILIEWQGKAAGSNDRLMTSRRGKMYKSEKYSRFQIDLIRFLRAAAIRAGGMIKGAVSVKLLFTISSQRDIDSLIKPVLDCLQHARCIENDRKVMQLWVSKIVKKPKSLDRIIISVDAMNVKYAGMVEGALYETG